MATRKFLQSSAIGLTVYLGINTLWGALYYFTNTLMFSSGCKVPDFWHCLYFSFVTASTIGYGDIISSNLIGHILIVVQSMLSILFVGIFGGYMAYLFLKRPDNIIISKSINIKPQAGNIFFTLRIGNKGKELNNAKLDIGFVEIKNDVKHTRYNKSIPYLLLEKSWHPSINLSDSLNDDFTKAFKNFYNNPSTMLIRVIVAGTDLQSGESIGLFRFYKVSHVQVSGKFTDIYHWKNLERTKANWSDFDKTEPISDQEKQTVIDFLKP
jgi:hypothetical protein